MTDPTNRQMPPVPPRPPMPPVPPPQQRQPWQQPGQWSPQQPGQGQRWQQPGQGQSPQGHPQPGQRWQQPVPPQQRVPHPRPPQPQRVPHPRGGEPSMYAPGVPRVDGRYDLSELDRQREEILSEDDELHVRWLPRFGRGVLVSLGLAAVMAVIVWGTGAGLAENKAGETITTEGTGLYVTIFLYVVALMFGAMDYAFIMKAAVQKWLPLTVFIFATTAMHAAVLTTSTLLWPYLADFAATGLFIDTWEPSAQHLFAVFLCCWASALGFYSGAIFMMRMLCISWKASFILGGSWLLASAFLLVPIVMVAKNVPASESSEVFFPIGIMLAVLSAMIIVPMPFIRTPTQPQARTSPQTRAAPAGDPTERIQQR